MRTDPEFLAKADNFMRLVENTISFFVALKTNVVNCFANDVNWDFLITLILIDLLFYLININPISKLV